MTTIITIHDHKKIKTHKGAAREDSCTSPLDSTQGVIFRARSEALKAPSFFRHFPILPRSGAILEGDDMRISVHTHITRINVRIGEDEQTFTATTC